MKTKTIHCFIDNDHIGSFTMKPTKKGLKEEWHKTRLFFEVLFSLKKDSYNFINEFPKDSLKSHMALYAYASSEKDAPSATEIMIRFAKNLKDANKVLVEWAAIN